MVGDIDSVGSGAERRESPQAKEAVLASKGAYMDVSDRGMQVQLTPEAKIASDFFFIGAIFAVVGFVSALCRKATPCDWI